MEKVKIGEKIVSKCEKCGQVMPFKATVLMTQTTAKCPFCGQEYFVEKAPIDWERAINGHIYTEKTQK